MKSRIHKLSALVLILISSWCDAQTITSHNPGLFGIDGDVMSDQVLNGSFTAAGSHDWFFKQGGTGIGIFDTIGTYAANQQISVGNNYSFTKKMKQARFTTNDGMLFIDGTYARDEIAVGGVKFDKTMFYTAQGTTNTSAMNPSNWIGTPAGGAPQDKTDIVDTYVHLRRLTNDGNKLIVYLGASTLGTTGNRYFDFEFYKSKLAYDSVTGTFSNSGPVATGGHSAFTFKSDGSINQYGDMTLSMSFSSTSVSSIDIYIWTDYTTYTTLVPRDFSFTSASWVGLSQNSGYGYVKIQPKAGNTFNSWGMVNTSNITSTPWGTNSKDLGSNSTSYYSTQYATGQFGEAAIDLTSLGIDPLIGVSTSQCAPPYTKVFIKSRASSSFSSALADFVKPMDFLDVVLPSANVAGPSSLTCSQTTGVLQPASIAANTNYTWSTTNGTLTSRVDSTYATFNKAGTYFLTASAAGCNVSILDSLIIGNDNYKPVASASYTGVITSDTNSYVTLKGGDTAASKYSTPYGTSQGLLWNWTGPNAYSKTIQNPTTKTAGTYKLVVTEIRNGCKDSVTLTVLQQAVLASNFLKFDAKEQNNKVELRWTVENNELKNYFEVQKSVNGHPFITIGSVPARASSGVQNYIYNDKLDNDHSISYRIVMADRDNSLSYSRILVFTRSELNSARILGNPVKSNLVLSYNSPESTSGFVNIFDASSGKKVSTTKFTYQKGGNIIDVPLSNSMSQGVYVVELTGTTSRVAMSFVKN